MTSIKNRLLN